jgi:hypothetical protein
MISCDVTRETTQTVQEILNKYLLIIQQVVDDVDESARAFIYIVYDWLSHTAHGPSTSTDPTTSLRDVVLQTTALVDPLCAHWLRNSIGAPLTLRTLVYRHYCIKRVLQEEIFTQQNGFPLYGLMGSMLTDHVVFTPLHTPTLWQGIDTDASPISVLRQKRPSIARCAHHLAMRDDLTVHQLIRDHGLLSALSLLYGLYLVRVIVIQEMVDKPNGALPIILESLSNTLTDLKGVFYNVESRRYVLDV